MGLTFLNHVNFTVNYQWSTYDTLDRTNENKGNEEINFSQGRTRKWVWDK